LAGLLASPSAFVGLLPSDAVGLLDSLPTDDAPVPIVELVPVLLPPEPGEAPVGLADGLLPAPPDDCANAKAALHIKRPTARVVRGKLVRFIDVSMRTQKRAWQRRIASFRSGA
jgi:hypothetical protein